MTTDGPPPIEQKDITSPPTGEEKGGFLGRFKGDAKPATAPTQTQKEDMPGKMGKLMAELKKKDAELDGGLITELGQKDGPLTLQRPIDTTDDTSDARRYTVVHDYLIVTKDGFKILRADTAKNTGTVKKFIDSWIQEGGPHSPWADVTKDLAQAINSSDRTRLGAYMAELIEDPKQEEIAKIIQTNVEAAKTERDAREAAKLADEAKKMAEAEAAQKPEADRLATENTKRQQVEKRVVTQSQAADNALDMLGKL